MAENPPAFPNSVPTGFQYAHDGMTLRDWFAGQIVNGMVAYSGTVGVNFGPGDIAKRSYEVADAMLAERSRGEAA